jgi:hypothetical protein
VLLAGTQHVPCVDEVGEWRSLRHTHVFPWLSADTTAECWTEQEENQLSHTHSHAWRALCLALPPLLTHVPGALCAWRSLTHPLTCLALSVLGAHSLTHSHAWRSLCRSNLRWQQPGMSLS